MGTTEGRGGQSSWTEGTEDCVSSSEFRIQQWVSGNTSVDLGC